MSEKFEYKYEAPTIEERKEIDSIRRAYLPENKQMSKIDSLRYLDSKVKTIPMIRGLTLGVIGTLLFRTGLTFFLEWTHLWYLGIPFALAGLVIVILTYPIYLKVLKKYKAKYGEEIIRISNELLENK